MFAAAVGENAGSAAEAVWVELRMSQLKLFSLLEPIGYILV